MSKNFPDLSQSDNNALAWGGLYETAGFAKKSASDRNAIAGVNERYKTQQEGTVACP